ncbi:LacI family DNA-binding transcriptional regulator [Xanthobacter sediminis]
MTKTAPTIRDVARLAGVSIGTVSRVINGALEVKPRIRKAVEDAIKELDYVPNAAAISMRKGRTRTVACIMRDISIPQLGGFISTAHNVLSEAGYSLMISNSEGKRQREIELLKSFANGQVDGILIAPYTPIEGEFEEVMHNLKLPIVMIDRDKPSWTDCVVADHQFGTRRATEHLISLGHERIALLTGPTSLFPGGSRLAGFLEAYAANKLEPVPDFVVTQSFLADQGYRTVSALLGMKAPPTAIISGGVAMLPGVLRAVRTRGKSVPEDVSLVAAGSTDLSELHQPPIAVVSWSQQEIGATAADLLLDRLERGYEGEPRLVLVRTEFLPHGSCVPPKKG